jgi:hypothetical protein
MKLVFNFYASVGDEVPAVQVPFASGSDANVLAG